MPDNVEAARCLNTIDPSRTAAVFQTFDDVAGRDDKSLSTLRHGTIDQHSAELQHLNARGAGVFFMVNRGDARGRKAENVVSIRSLFIDLDGAPLDAVRICGIDPHLIVQTSIDKWHCYWRVSDCPLSEFKAVQQALAARFDSDPSVCDLPRVMRLPGFVHQKNPKQPYSVKIVDEFSAPPYRLEHLVSELGLEEARQRTRTSIAGINTDEILTAGARHRALLRLAGRQREQGMHRDEILDALRAVNQRRCKPPKSDVELNAIARFVGEKKPGGDLLKKKPRPLAPIPIAVREPLAPLTIENALRFEARLYRRSYGLNIDAPLSLGQLNAIRSRVSQHLGIALPAIAMSA